jgi:hypothetical protein
MISAFRGSTKKIDVFTNIHKSTRGTFGSGYYFADYNCAWEYADGLDEGVTEVELHPVNTYEYSVPKAYEGDFPGTLLVKALFTPEKALEINSLSGQSDGYIGIEVESELLSNGYDSLFVTYSDGSQELIMYNHNKIKTIH